MLFSRNLIRILLLSAIGLLKFTYADFSPEAFQISLDEKGRMKMKPKGATLITPVKAIAVFFDSSRYGFWTGTARGSITFSQSNYPNHPATMVKIGLVFPPWHEDRTYLIEVLFNGTLDRRYCQDGIRYVELHRFKLPANERFYATSFKRYDVNVIDDNETVIGRTIRVICTDCHYGSHRMGGCTIIGRSDDELYMERGNGKGDYILSSTNIDDFFSSERMQLSDLQPKVISVVRNPVPEHLISPRSSRTRN